MRRTQGKRPQGIRRGQDTDEEESEGEDVRRRVTGRENKKEKASDKKVEVGGRAASLKFQELPCIS